MGTSYVNVGGNIDKNPMFILQVDPSTAPTSGGNLRLKKGSPATDTGKNKFVTVSFDLDNNARIVDGNNDGAPTVDMGAFETQIYSYLPMIFR